MSASATPVFVDYRNAFEDAVSRYSPILFRVALRRLRNVQDAEDAVQDALLSAYKHIGQFEGRSRLSTWLTTIVSNVALMKLRRRSRYEMLSIDHEHEDDGAAFARELKDTTPNPENLCAQAEMEEALRRALDQLSPKLRSAIQMCELDGLSVQEAAQTVGISKNALKSRLLRARLKLGELLRDSNRIIRPSSGDAPVTDQEDVDGHKHNDAKLQIECEQRCYPPHIPESALHPYPQGYAA
ncbi:MAG TPA: RNA polymerase sigma factor [Candidatus Acidoferrales bacterium]|nr:RNA polymerase sigma factor [Candidatus Acidoferrales bacterium]